MSRSLLADTFTTMAMFLLVEVKEDVRAAVKGGVGRPGKVEGLPVLQEGDVFHLEELALAPGGRVFARSA